MPTPGYSYEPLDFNGTAAEEALVMGGEVRVTTKKMKFEARKLIFCIRGSVGRPHPKIEKTHAYAKCQILISLIK